MTFTEKIVFITVIPLIGVFLWSCASPEKNHSTARNDARVPVKMAYAKKFQVWRNDNLLEISINSGFEYIDSITYTLVPVGTPVPENLETTRVITVPVKDMVVTSTSHVPFLDLLDATEYLVGFPNTRYISSARVRDRIEKGLVAEVGTVNGINFESLIELNPDLVVTYISGNDHSELDPLEQTGVPWILNLDFMEETPLGRAEWIKFMGYLTGKSAQADSVFSIIEQDYLRLLKLAHDVTDKPTVFSGIMYGDTWFAPGAKSFAANFIEDAGGVYTWNELDHSGSAELSLEAVLDRNSNTEYWIGTGQYLSRTSLEQADPRYTHFRAFNSGQVYNYHRRIGDTGGFEYFELGGARPDLVLADIIKILHPDLLPNHQMYFYKRLD